LSVAAIALSRMVQPDGTLREPIGPRDLPGIVKSSLECLAFAHGASSEDADPTSATEQALRHAPDDVREVVSRGLRALYDWRQQHERP
jgi:hypothetical protein